jgi:hypothetical protein
VWTPIVADEHDLGKWFRLEGSLPLKKFPLRKRGSAVDAGVA